MQQTHTGAHTPRAKGTGPPSQSSLGAQSSWPGLRAQRPPVFGSQHHEGALFSLTAKGVLITSMFF